MKNQVLVETDETSLRLALTAASARRKSALAWVDKARREARPLSLVADQEKLKIQKDRALLEVAQVSLEQARDALDENEELLRSGPLPVDSVPGLSQNFKRTRAYLNDTLSTTQAAQQDLQAAEQTLERNLNQAENFSDDTLQLMEDQLNESTIAEQIARNRLEQAKIRSPVSGEISSRHVEPGEVIFPERALFTICVPEEKWIEAYITELVKQKIGYMSQKFSLYEDLTVNENLSPFLPGSTP